MSNHWMAIFVIILISIKLFLLFANNKSENPILKKYLTIVERIETLLFIFIIISLIFRFFS